MKLVTPLLPACWSIYLHLLLAFTINLICFSSALEKENDRQALLKFKESMSNDPDPYEILSSWNSSTNFCSWHGITCGQRHQRVIKLNLEGYHLQGFISPHIGNLSFLRTLNLQKNKFHSEIPRELGRLFRLRLLFLSNNMLAGEIPANLTSCSKLRRLYLQGNNLSGKIPVEIGSLRELRWLWLAKNDLSGRIPNSIWNLSSLVVLYISDNYFQGNIPEDIGSLKHLQVLDVVSNKLSGMLPSSLYNMSSLTYISVVNNQLIGSLPFNMFFSLPNLRCFWIGDNRISGSIPTSIANATLLEIFDITNNSLVGQVPSLAKLHGISWLNFGTNHLGTYSAKDSEFLYSLQNCSKLAMLDINSNNFGGPLPENIANFSTQLTELYLGGNQLSGKILATLGDLVQLYVLSMEKNNFIGIIPATFVKFQTMKILDLSRNVLSGEIPSFMGNLSQLLDLSLSSNMLEGNIPPRLGNCQHLQYLDLSNNNLSGVIPPQVIGLSSLTILLNLCDNSLTGSLPEQVGSLKFIRHLDVSENRLSGDIPGTIGGCRSLEYLSLEGNSFSGIIPSLDLVRGLEYLDLSRNNLSGSIPTALQDISVLEYLNVSFNMLDGEVPTKGVFKNATAIALIGNIKLCGGISELQLPPCQVRGFKHNKQHNFKLMAVIGSVVALLLLISSMFAIYKIRKRKNKPSSDSENIGQLDMVSYQRLHQATNGFSGSNLIGSGNFGSVYKGSLGSTDKVVAIKVLNLCKKGGHKSFIAECNALKNIRHRNLVNVLTCCSSTDYKGQEFKALLFKYMKYGSLDKWLHQDIQSAGAAQTLSLNQRINILIDVAYAMHYLHYECEQPVAHCDIKPSNILLDDDMVAHVGDFSLARLLSTMNATSCKQNITSGIIGTFGYAPPEYGMGSEVSTQGDMYSFGILVLEMLTGRRPTEEAFKDGHNLSSYVKMALPDEVLQIVDPVILSTELDGTTPEEGNQGNLTLNPNAEKSLLSLFRIGLACSVESSKERTSIVDAIKELNLIRNSLVVGGINRN